MAGSRSHEELVRAIMDWLQVQHPAAETISISADCIFCEHLPNPPLLNGFIPDVYAVGIAEPRTIIGEAKTPRDLETPRSRAQLEAFLTHLCQCQNAQFIIATPWPSVNSAKAIVRSITKRRHIDGVAVVFLEPLSP